MIRMTSNGKPYKYKVNVKWLQSATALCEKLANEAVDVCSRGERCPWMLAVSLRWLTAMLEQTVRYRESGSEEDN